jgi:hypothetical protein
MATQGVAVLDFGSGDDFVSVTVTGQAWVTLTTDLEAWLQAEATSDNDAEAHALAAALVDLTIGSNVAGVGFTIYAVCEDASLTGTFNVSWVGN